SCIVVPEELSNFILNAKFILPSEEEEKKMSDFEILSDSDEEIKQNIIPLKFEKKLLNLIVKFGGNVFPKFNQKAPIDAKWININYSLLCTSCQEIYILLKASNKILLNSDNDKNELVIKKWININPAYEFRCYVIEKKLFAISQRDVTHKYDYIQDECLKICEETLLFFNNYLNSFPEKHYSFDIYRPCSDKIILIDINPHIPDQQSYLLFNLDDFNCSNISSIKASYFYKSDEKNEIAFRFIQDMDNIQLNSNTFNMLPDELLQFDQLINIQNIKETITKLNF
ncbi:unnamed protein product, partial [Gordionus sp. m RMFG-2023]